jgi:hypothetical protein
MLLVGHQQHRPWPVLKVLKRRITIVGNRLKGRNRARCEADALAERRVGERVEQSAHKSASAQ